MLSTNARLRGKAGVVHGTAQQQHIKNAYAANARWQMGSKKHRNKTNSITPGLNRLVIPHKLYRSIPSFSSTHIKKHRLVKYPVPLTSFTWIEALLIYFLSLQVNKVLGQKRENTVLPDLAMLENQE